MTTHNNLLTLHHVVSERWFTSSQLNCRLNSADMCCTVPSNDLFLSNKFDTWWTHHNFFTGLFKKDKKSSLIMIRSLRKAQSIMFRLYRYICFLCSKRFFVIHSFNTVLSNSTACHSAQLIPLMVISNQYNYIYEPIYSLFILSKVFQYYKSYHRRYSSTAKALCHSRINGDKSSDRCSMEAYGNTIHHSDASDQYGALINQ